MRDRSDGREVEGVWARELDKPLAPALERQVQHAEQKIRGEGQNLADVRADWARFDAANPMQGDAFQRDFVTAQNLAYARVVNDMLRQETGQGLREQYPSQEQPAAGDDDLADMLYGVRSAPPAAREPPPPEAPKQEAPMAQDPRAVVDNTDVKRAAPAPAGPPLADFERLAVRAEAQERIMRPVSPTRPPEVRPEQWYLERARALEVSDPKSFGSVEREVGRLKDLQQLSTSARVVEAVKAATVDFERAREANAPNAAQLRTRLYALSLIHEAKVREESLRLVKTMPAAPRPAQPATTQPEVKKPVPSVTQPVPREPVQSVTQREPTREEPHRPVPAPSAERDHTPGSAPRLARFQVGDTDPRAEVRADTDQRSDAREDDTIPEVVARASERSDVFANAEISTNPGRKGTPLARERGPTEELNTHDILDARADVRARDAQPDPTLNARLTPGYRERAGQVEHELANVAADADRERFSLERDAKEDRGAALELAQTNAAVDRIRAAFGSHDPYDLAARVNALRERERNEPDITDGSLRAERLAYGLLAREAFERQSALLNTSMRDRLDEVRHMPPESRQELLKESAVLLQEAAYNDRPTVNRELLRADNDRQAQHFAIARKAPSIVELHRDAKWRDDAFHARVERRVQAHLLQPEGDAALARRLAEARVRAALPSDVIEDRLAREEAVEIAEVMRRLPIARSLEVDTPASPFRALNR